VKFGSRKRQRLTAIDRRQAARAAHLAAKVELLRRFVAGIEHTGRLQPFDRGVVDLETSRLIFGGVWKDAQPVQVIQDGIGELLLRAGNVCVVEALDEPALVVHGEQPVEQRGARIADMDAAGRRWGKTYGNCHERGVANAFWVDKTRPRARATDSASQLK
jgi:hypothetical protein